MQPGGRHSVLSVAGDMAGLYGSGQCHVGVAPGYADPRQGRK